ncbi:MAG: aminotransferase class I/II-fold pyridoxal phosphate-dependent enzyme [Leptospiraceae bacterium]|nr:aminotransferase class I/II-fold pyridoxal phosphate-dependent enzyme [Leptospiraceae bacterium]
MNTELSDLQKEYQEYQNAGLQLDMTRGKPSAAQLDLSNAMLDRPLSASLSRYTPDIRNYGGLEGLPGLRELFAQMMQVDPDDVLVGGNSSLSLMHDTILRALLLGVPGGGPWSQNARTRFLCPSPGYDRHFAICETFGIEMLPIAMTPTGPDMDAVESMVATDESIKGIWIVPKYSNPGGITCSAETVDRLGRMQTKAADFRIFWDNAYGEHHLFAGVENQDQLTSLKDACQKHKHPDRYYIFASTSKVSFAGAGIAAMASSPANVAALKKMIGIQTIGPDKINQARHLEFFGDYSGLQEHMSKHAALIRPKFEMVDRVLGQRLQDVAGVRWSKPRGGYFISLDVWPNTARRVVELCQACGVKMTAAGATWPYGKDPQDSNIRIAPTLPAIEDIQMAMQVLACSILMAGAQADQTGTV